MGEKRKLLVNSSLYGGFHFISSAINFILIPFYTFYLTPYEMGIRGVVQTIIGLLSLFCSLSLNMAIMKFYSIYKNKNDIKYFISSISNFIVLWTLGVTIILLVIWNKSLYFIAQGIDFFPYIFLGLLTLSISPLYSIFLTIQQVKEKAKLYAIFNICYFILNTVLIFSSLILVKAGVIGLLISQLITNFVFFVLSIAFIYKYYGVYMKLNYLKIALKYSIPLTPASLSGWILDMVDRLFLNNMKTTETVGIYSIGYSISSIISTVVSSIHKSLNPWFMNNLSKSNNQENINYMISFIINIYCIIALFLSLWGKEVLMIFINKDYHNAWIVIPFLSFSYVFIGIYYFWGYFVLHDLKMSKLINIPTFVSALISIILNIILIPSIGLLGAAISTFTTYLISSIITYFIAKQIIPDSYEVKKFYKTIFYYFMLNSVLLLNEQINFTYNVILKLIVSLIPLYIFYKNHKKTLIYFKMIIINRYIYKTT